MAIENRDNSFLDSTLYQAPEQLLHQSVDALTLPADIKQAWHEYLTPFLEEAQNNPKDPAHQDRMKKILDALIERGLKEEAGLIFNIHRTLTGFRGYGPNDNASQDVADCFNDQLNIPDRGLIVVDHFVTRNLPAVVIFCKKNNIDLSRIRVRVPKGAWAVQAMGLSGMKKQEFEDACAELTEDQFLIEDVKHVQDIKIDGKVAVMLSPRTGAIYPRLHAETENETVDNYRGWIRERIKNLVPGGRMLLNIAKVDEFEPLGTEMNEKGLAKLTSSVSEKVSRAILRETNKRNATILANGEFDLPDYDHSKTITRYHAQKPESFRSRVKNRLKYWWRKISPQR